MEFLKKPGAKSNSDDSFLQITSSFFLAQYHLSLSTLVRPQHVLYKHTTLAFPTSRKLTRLRIFIRPRNSDFEPSFQCFLRPVIDLVGVILHLDIPVKSIIRHTRQPVSASMSAERDESPLSPRVNLAERFLPPANAATIAVSITRRLPKVFFCG